ncbi:hypothetical protein ISG10_34860, partial [Burkholderia pseudomallei]|nr:hypothetical protein [Burkholderia pseudomallei]MBF3604999.1 hypothetical protein [Burkholderia pseudomallei]
TFLDQSQLIYSISAHRNNEKMASQPLMPTILRSNANRSMRARLPRLKKQSRAYRPSQYVVIRCERNECKDCGENAARRRADAREISKFAKESTVRIEKTNKNGRIPIRWNTPADFRRGRRNRDPGGACRSGGGRRARRAANANRRPARLLAIDDDLVERAAVGEMRLLRVRPVAEDLLDGE